MKKLQSNLVKFASLSQKNLPNQIVQRQVNFKSQSYLSMFRMQQTSRLFSTTHEQKHSDCSFCYYKHQKLDCNPCKYLDDISLLKKVDYFQFYCLPHSYDIDMISLNQHYKQYQKFIHPDKFQLAADDLLENSNELSSFANNAYFTLINEVSRAIYLLRIKGVKVLDEDHQMDDMDFMEIIFSIRMEIDQSDSIDKLLELYGQVNSEYQKRVSSLSQLFKENRNDEIKQYIEEIQYLDKIMEEISQKEVHLKSQE